MSTISQARRIRKDDQDHFERTRLPDFIKPTRETEGKLRPDPLAIMVAREAINGSEKRAALEICEVFTALCGIVGARSQWPSGGSRRTSGAPKTGRIHEVYDDHYKPWADELSKWRSSGGPPILEVTLDLVVDGVSCIEIEARNGWKTHGTAAEMVRYGLGLYTAKAGWDHPSIALERYRAGWQRRRRKIALQDLQRM